MKILNLTNLDTSDIKYKVIQFPDGQQSFEITNLTLLIPNSLLGEIIIIKSRLNNFKDLEIIICANQALQNLGASIIHLYVPYITGERSDRKFQIGGINYLKQVVCPIINNQHFSSVTCIDPHSDVLEACLNRFEKYSNIDLVRWSLRQIDNKNEAQNRTLLISPDGGALKKIYDVAKEFGIQNVTTASKIREISTGKIIRTEVPTMNLDGVEHIIIVDDICDGGRTFIELAKEIQKQTDKPIYLIVTHGIFSAGFNELDKYFKGIYTTNSVKNIGDVEADVTGNLHPTNIKQLNIFK
jgi:ribose-phosphate pyrophosphokinase